MILVTGATGLVGGNLLWQLLQENERVKAIRRTTSNLAPLRTIFSFYTPDPDVFLARIDWEIADVMDANSMQTALKDVSVVYHCAAQVSLVNSGGGMLDTNVVGTRNMVEAALGVGVQKMCFVSSIAACGHASGQMLIDENLPWEGNSHSSVYSQSKYFSEQEVWKGIEKGLNAVIVNPGVILGISGTESGSSQLFSQVRKGLMFYTNGGTGYIDVQDVVRAMVQLTKSDISGERFILVGENCSNKDILSWMADGFGKRRPFIGIGRRVLGFAGFSMELLGKIFGFRPVIDSTMARTASKREYFSTRKIENALDFQVKPIEKCIAEVCSFMKNNQY
jgi:nucleoside-diphosphate-sugar epimerase